MSLEFAFRLVGMVVFGLLGGYGGAWMAVRFAPDQLELYTSTFALLGGALGLVLTPFLTTRPVRALRAQLGRLSAETLFSGLIGLVVGLLIAALLAFPLSLLPDPLGSLLPFLGVLIFSYFGVSVFVMRQTDILNAVGALTGRQPAAGGALWRGTGRTVLLDTSVIIDGRVADIARTGFLPATLLIPRFILNELQYIADSPDGVRRARGRRGMEVLAELQKTPSVVVRISDMDVEGVRDADTKLVMLARQLHCPILTNDFNLNRIAELQGVTILNINELANAVKSVVLPGESLRIQVIQEGREYGQGVGYLDDGTMVVVENGRDLIGQELEVEAVKVLQTAAGRMIFARVRSEEEAREEKKPRKSRA